MTKLRQAVLRQAGCLTGEFARFARLFTTQSDVIYQGRVIGVVLGPARDLQGRLGTKVKLIDGRVVFVLRGKGTK